MRLCAGCQNTALIPKYRTALELPVRHLFEVFSTDFAGPLPPTRAGNHFLFICVEHLTGWPIAVFTPSVTAQVVKKIVQDDIIHSFGPSGKVISDNATCSTAAKVALSLTSYIISWKTVQAYAPV